MLARAFIDYRCDHFFQELVDAPIEGASVSLHFANGARATLQTTRDGFAYFSGFDAADGITVSVDIPERVRQQSVRYCSGSPPQVRLGPDDFPFGQKSLLFGAKALGQNPGP